MTVYVCSEKDVACGEVFAANRCERCPLRAPTSPAAPVPAQPSDVQMQQDAARYRWLRDKTAEKHPDFYADVDRWSVSKERRGTGQCFSGERLDAAIDAAMGKTTGSEGMTKQRSTLDERIARAERERFQLGLRKNGTGCNCKALTPTAYGIRPLPKHQRRAMLLPAAGWNHVPLWTHAR